MLTVRKTSRRTHEMTIKRYVFTRIHSVVFSGLKLFKDSVTSDYATNRPMSDGGLHRHVSTVLRTKRTLSYSTMTNTRVRGIQSIFINGKKEDLPRYVYYSINIVRVTTFKIFYFVHDSSGESNSKILLSKTIIVQLHFTSHYLFESL